MATAQTEKDIELLAALWADMIASGEASGSCEAFDTIGEREGYEVADKVCVYLNAWGVKLY